MAIVESIPLLVAAGTLEVLSLDLVVEVRDELLGGHEDSVLVLEVAKSFHDFIEFDTPLLYNFLHMRDVCLDIVEDEVAGLVLVILELLELNQGLFVILGSSDREAVFHTLPINEFQFSQELFTLLDLHLEL